MRGFCFVLKAVLAVSIMLAGFAAVGGLDRLAERQANEAVPPRSTVRVKSEAAPSAASREPVSDRAFEPSSAASTRAAETSLAEATPAPAERPFGGSARNDFQGQELMRLAAAAPRIPAPTFAHIPPLVVKFAPAKALFGAMDAPSNMAASSVGFYSKGCLAGAKPLPLNGPAWQAMRISRNRMWGHPTLVRYVERFAKDAKAKDGWTGLLVGDMSMPRGGPMPFGHASHQVGLDVDIWYKPMPGRALTYRERETLPMESFLLDPGRVNPSLWTPDHAKLLRRAASYPEVARVFVNPAIKKWLCDNVNDDRSFLHKVTPISGHDAHFHVRLVCPAGNEGCRNQPPISPDEGCGKSLDDWIEKLSKAPPVPVAPAPASRPAATPVRASGGRRLITLAQLPFDCRTVLQAPARTVAR